MIHNFHDLLTNLITASEAQYLKPEYLHLHESDIKDELEGYSLLNYLYRFIESVPNLKSELDSLICCYSFEEKSNTSALYCQRKNFFYLEIDDFDWMGIENFCRKLDKYRVRPQLYDILDKSNGIANLLNGYDVVQPYILKQKNSFVEPIFDYIKKPKLIDINNSIDSFQKSNAYQADWYGFKFKKDKQSFWIKGTESKNRLHILSTGFIYHILQWNHELKNAHSKSKTMKDLEFSTLINISAHVFKTAIKTDIISEIDTIETEENKNELKQLKENAMHLFVLTGIYNLLTKINEKQAFRESAQKDALLDDENLDWKIKYRIEQYSNGLYKRKGFKIVPINSEEIPKPQICVHNLFFSEHLIKSFFNTLLENIESHGYFEKYIQDEVCFVEITSHKKEWVFKNRAKKKFRIDSHKLTGNLLLYKSLIEKTGSGEIIIDCKEEDEKIFFILTIRTN